MGEYINKRTVGMQSKVEEIRHDLREARNFAYLGRYEDSIKQFRKIVDSIEQETILNNIQKKSIEDWRKFQGEVINEKNAVEAIRAMLSGINNNSSLLSTDRPLLREDRPLPYANNSINYEDPARKTKSNFRATNRGFSANRKQNEEKPFKDPDVWDSPPPMEKRQSVQKVGKSQGSKSHQVRSLPPKKKGETGGKKTFLNDRYPEGSGPDSNLIEMLER